MILVVGTHGGGGSRPSADGTRQALRWLGAPPTLLALAVLALNDHVLKHSWPSFTTGKLSDVAGLVVAPVLVALPLTLLRVPRAPLVALVATGAGFTWVKTTYLGAAVASAAWTHVWGTSVVLCDPTDLLALPALAAAWIVMQRALRDRATVRRRAGLAVGALVLPFAVVATAATSCSDPYSAPTSVGIVEGRWDGTRKPEARLVFDGIFETVVLSPVGSWRAPTSGEGERMTDLGPQLREACDPAAPRHCWRIGRGRRPQVDATTDGGATWTTEYVLPQRTFDAIRKRAEEEDRCGSDEARVEGDDIAVLGTDGGPVVAVAAAEADLLLRDTSGRWTRRHDLVDYSRSDRPSLLPEELITPVEPTPSPTGSPTGPGQPPAGESEPVCPSPSMRTVTPDPRNGPPTSYPVCPT